MATSTFKYCSQRDVKDVYPNIDETDDKVIIRNWVETGTSNLYLARNCGLVTVLFVDGEDLGSPEANSGVVNVNGEWYYDSNLDTVYYFNSASDPNELLMEAGEDWATLIDRMIVNCSMELSSMLDARFPRPIPKAFQYAEATDGSDTPEYDYIVKRSTALLVAHHLLVAKNPNSEIAESLMFEITNVDNTGIVDKLNDGRMKLAFEVDRKDQSGDIIEVTRTGSMYLMETWGEWHGEPFDRIKLKCTTAGVYGTAKIDVSYYGDNKLYGETISGVIVNGALTDLLQGLWIRFEGNSMAEDDEWHIVIRNFSLNSTNSGVRTIRASHSNAVGILYRDRGLEK